MNESIKVGILKPIINNLPDDMVVSINNGKVIIEGISTSISMEKNIVSSIQEEEQHIVIPDSIYQIILKNVKVSGLPKGTVIDKIAQKMASEFIDTYIRNGYVLSGPCMRTELNSLLFKVLRNGSSTDALLKLLINNNQKYIKSKL